MFYRFLNILPDAVMKFGDYSDDIRSYVFLCKVSTQLRWGEKLRMYLKARTFSMQLAKNYEYQFKLQITA